MTQKLYYIDSHLFAFTAKVLSCEEGRDRWEIILDKTAFFPEGGGQPADRGVLNGVTVLDVQERGDKIIHYCDGPLEVDGTVDGYVDRELRLCRMQNHSGEHVFSGIAHRLYGCENVGFHMGNSDLTIDFDRELSEEEVLRIETEANQAVRENLPIRATFPSKEELSRLAYRSKKELQGDVRIVEIPGVDRCACCAPHVSNTGEIGLIKVLTFERHRGGVRLVLACGMWALREVREKQNSVAEISVLLSAKRNEVAGAVQRLLQERDTLKEKNAMLAMELVHFKAAQQPETDGNICLFEAIPDEIAVRELVNLLMEKCGGIAAVFFPGIDGVTRYIIGSRHVDLRKASRDINTGISGRGGGRPEMIQGSASASEEEIRTFIFGFQGLQSIDLYIE